MLSTQIIADAKIVVNEVSLDRHVHNVVVSETQMSCYFSWSLLVHRGKLSSKVCIDTTSRHHQLSRTSFNCGHQRTLCGRFSQRT